MASPSSRARRIEPNAWLEIGSSFEIQIAAQVSSSRGASMLLLVTPRPFAPFRVSRLRKVYTRRDAYRSFHPADKRVALRSTLAAAFLRGILRAWRERADPAEHQRAFLHVHLLAAKARI